MKNKILLGMAGGILLRILLCIIILFLLNTVGNATTQTNNIILMIVDISRVLVFVGFIYLIVNYIKRKNK
jgi:CDP-diglyceride synthetase